MVPPEVGQAALVAPAAVVSEVRLERAVNRTRATVGSVIPQSVEPNSPFLRTLLYFQGK
ncbi:hypothetical protein [Streptomyces sp. ISL-94]|uniref:hypothetical protein n=1 Tax=Streptomyces sp. ISL-94 TaxID=2819190 RepID=UPI0035B1A890